MAKRYGQRPSSLLPQGTIEDDIVALAFDYNVMLLGLAAEIRAQQEAQHKNSPGFTSTRQEAYSLAYRARKAADEIDAELIH